MPNNWKKYKLTELGALARGKSKNRPRDASFLYGGAYPFIQTGDIKNANHRIFNYTQTYSEAGLKQSKLWPKDTLCLTIAANIGDTAILNFPACFPDSVLGFVADKNKCNIEFVEYLLQHYKKEIQSHSIGSVQDNINLSTFEKVEFNLPPLPEQQAIAEILSSLDDKIELNLQTNKTLEEMANALYKHWFVDFGPFKDGKFVESELGLIPEGWEVKTLGSLLKIKHGYAFKGANFTSENTGKLVLTPGNFERSGGIKFSLGKEKFYNASYPVNYELSKGQLIIALTDLTPSCDILGAAALIIDENLIYLHNQRLGLVEINNSSLSNIFFYYVFNSKIFREFIKASKTGSTVSHTAPDRICKFKIAVPNERCSLEVEKDLERFQQMINHNLLENQFLKQTRDYLLPKLISGEVRVKNAAIIVNEVI